MNIGIIGCGRWGSFLAWYLDRVGHRVTLYGRETSGHMRQLLETRNNGLLTLPDSVALTTELSQAVKVELFIISVNSQGLRSLMRELTAFNIAGKPIVLCMKGLEIETGKRLSEIVSEYAPGNFSTAVWLGPGHVQEFYGGIPNCMVIDSEDEALKVSLVTAFSSDLIRFYYGQDMLGNEIGAAAKNVIGIAAGMLDGLGLPTLKGALTSRGTLEISRLIQAMGGNALSAYGLCHLGDYGATVFSRYSHNRRYGEAFVRGEAYGELAEGVYTVKALLTLGERYHVELPICSAVYDALYNSVDPMEAIGRLFARSLKPEF